ncbi:MAG: DNA glycosylase [Armatimonadota bacterium]|jgi:N-glycosylase/DNA lyase
MESWSRQEIGRIQVDEEELNLTHTLTPGQSFRWKSDSSHRWMGVVRGRVVRIWREGAHLLFQMVPGGPDKEFIQDYFRLDTRLSLIYKELLASDGRLKAAVERFCGLRIVRQEPEETLLSYICSAANSIPRIVQSIEALSCRYGEHIATIDNRDYFAFPKAEALANANVEEMSGVCSLGFRCANLSSVSAQLMERSVEWLNNLRRVPYETAREELLEIRRVGLKIADCVLLFSLDKDQAVPVDTHIRQVAVKYYLPEFKQKTLTPAVYNAIAGFFQQKFGRFAGWAQEYLFYDDLIRR